MLGVCLLIKTIGRYLIWPGWGMLTRYFLLNRKNYQKCFFFNRKKNFAGKGYIWWEKYDIVRYILIYGITKAPGQKSKIIVVNFDYLLIKGGKVIEPFVPKLRLNVVGPCISTKMFLFLDKKLDERTFSFECHWLENLNKNKSSLQCDVNFIGLKWRRTNDFTSYLFTIAGFSMLGSFNLIANTAMDMYRL